MGPRLEDFVLVQLASNSNLRNQQSPGLGCLRKGLWAATQGDPAPATSDPDPLNLLPGLREVAGLGGTFSLWLASGLSSMCSRAKPGGGGSDLVPHHSWRSCLIRGALRGEDRVLSSYPAMPIPGPQPHPSPASLAALRSSLAVLFRAPSSLLSPVPTTPFLCHFLLSSAPTPNTDDRFL